MKQQKHIQIKPVEVIVGVLVAVGMMMLFSVIGAILINKNVVPEDQQVHIAFVIHFISVCISTFAVKLIYKGDNILQTILYACVYFLILLVVHTTMKTDYFNVLTMFVAVIGGTMPSIITELLKKKGKSRGYKYRFR